MKKEIYYLMRCTYCNDIEIIHKDDIYFKHKCGGLLIIVGVLYINSPYKKCLYY
jgi:hypothetical protein